MPTYSFEREKKITDCYCCPFLDEPEDEIGGMCYHSTCEYDENNSKDRGFLWDDGDYVAPDWCPLKEVKEEQK